jgi:hypothetical protein
VTLRFTHSPAGTLVSPGSLPAEVSRLH